MDKIKNIELFLNGPDIWSIHFDFITGSFYHSLSKNNFTIRKNIINLSLTYSWLTVINNLGNYDILIFNFYFAHLNKNDEIFLIVIEKSFPRLLIIVSQEYVKERLMMFCLIVKLFFDKE